MQIYILRHAIAEDVPKGGGGDARRALTAEGRKKMKEAAAGFARLQPRIDQICSSPLVRAMQTAEIIADALKYKGQIEKMQQLAPGHSPAEVVKQLQGLHNQAVILSGHEPNCSQLASYLLAGGEYVDLEFKKGCISLIETETAGPGSGMLIWHLPPSVLRLLAG